MPPVDLAENMFYSIHEYQGGGLLRDLFEHGGALLEHSLGVTSLSVVLASHMGVPSEEIELLGKCSLFHDVGKLALEPDILYKKEKLTKTEFEHIQGHTVLGYELIKDGTELPAFVSEAALYHHEKGNGRGYPYGKKVEFIHPLIRLITVADIFDAVRTKRSYREKPFSTVEAFEILECQAEEELLDKGYVQIAREVYEQDGFRKVSEVKNHLVYEMNETLKGKYKMCH